MEVSSNQHIPNDTFPPPPAPACTIKVSYVDAANNTHTYQLDVGQTDDTLGKLASAILAKAKLSEQGEATISVTRDVGAEGTAQIRVIQGDSISTLPDTIKITDKALEALKNAQSAKGSTKPALPPYPRVSAKRTDGIAQPTIQKSCKSSSLIELEENPELPPPPPDSRIPDEAEEPPPLLQMSQ